LFADDAVITVPGATFSGPDVATQFIRFIEPRFEWVDKEFERWLEGEGHVVSIGTLYGVDSSGEPFEDVRYVDVYECSDGSITRLDIYNNLADEGVV